MSVRIPPQEIAPMKLSRLRFGVSSLAAAGASLVAATAYAASAPSPSAKCETTLECSSGQAALKASSRTRLTTSVDTGWLPSCGVADPNADHCGSKPLQFRANIAFDAPDSESQSLYEIDMQKGA